MKMVIDIENKPKTETLEEKLEEKLQDFFYLKSGDIFLIFKIKIFKKQDMYLSTEERFNGVAIKTNSFTEKEKLNLTRTGWKCLEIEDCFDFIDEYLK